MQQNHPFDEPATLDTELAQLERARLQLHKMRELNMNAAASWRGLSFHARALVQHLFPGFTDSAALGNAFEVIADRNAYELDLANEGIDAQMGQIGAAMVHLRQKHSPIAQPGAPLVAPASFTLRTPRK